MRAVRAVLQRGHNEVTRPESVAPIGLDNSQAMAGLAFHVTGNQLHPFGTAAAELWREDGAQVAVNCGETTGGPKMVSKSITLLTLAVLTLSMSDRAEAQPADYRTYFTFSAPVTLPGVTLPAGKYVFRLADADSSRKVINVLSGDGKRSLAMLHTIPNQVMKAPKDAEIRFMETSAKVPPPIKTWWYAGKAIGYEFIYPRQQALQLAKATSEPILTTSQETTDLANADLSRVSGEDAKSAAVRVDENPSPAEARGRAQQADADQTQAAAPSAPARSPGASASSRAPARDVRADEPARSTARTELPRTASSTPLVLLFGVLSVAFGLGLTLASRVRA